MAPMMWGWKAPPILVFAAFVSSAVGATVLSRPAGYVTDGANVLGPEARQTLEAIAAEVDQKSGAEIAVVTVASLDGETVETYAVELFKAWGIGKKGKDNGVLLLVAPQDRKLRIEVGYGLEGVLPDGKTGEIRDRCLVPAFRRGDFSAGALCAVAEMARVILGAEPAAAAGTPRPAQRKVLTGMAVMQALFLLAFVVMMMRQAVSPRRRGLFWPGFWLGGGFGGGFGGGGFGGGGFGGFGGGGSGGGGSSGSW